jgi:hypothetical protein
MLINDPRDGARLAVKHQASESSKIPIGVNRVVWPDSTGDERISTLNWNPGDEPVDDPIATMSDRDIRETFGVGDAAPEPNMLSFFNGKPHADGVKALNEYLASKGRN